jgi:hypothetical protein
LEYESPDVNMTLSVNDIFSVVCGITVFSFISVSAFEKYGVFSLLIFQKTIWLSVEFVLISLIDSCMVAGFVSSVPKEI